MGKALPSEEITVRCVQHVTTGLSHKRWMQYLWMDIMTFEELINYVIASWLPIGRLPRKVCALVVFYIPLLLSCLKPAFD